VRRGMGYLWWDDETDREELLLWEVRYSEKTHGIIFILMLLNYSARIFRIKIRGLPGVRPFFSQGIASDCGTELRS
jgi:hypothetical protein